MDFEFLSVLGLALLGGVILNVMPCVLPVLTMKVFHLVERGSGAPREQRLHGLAYTGGILAAFLALASVLVLLRASGEMIGWGMQFQNPAFVATMIAIVFALGLNSLGMFEWNVSLSTRPGREGYGASFANGIFAAVMSTPCSAPYVGTVATFALGAGATAWQTLSLFAAIGLGLASPFLLVSFVPAIGRRLPKPGPWMEIFKHLMGFSLLATAVWLFHTFAGQVSRSASSAFLAFLLALTIALWGVHHFGGVIHGTVRRLVVRVLAVAWVVGAGVWLLDFTPAVKDLPVATSQSAQAADGRDGPIVKDDRIVWRPFDPARIAAEGRRHRLVFADFTADWCMNCKANEKLVIETDPVRKLLSQHDILPMKADYSTEDEGIWKALQKLGRSGVPAYVIYLPDGSWDLLPEQITTPMLTERLTAAATKVARIP